MNTYKITLKHDKRKINITTTAKDEKTAVLLVTNAENCPENAVVKIKDITPKYYVTMTDKFMSGWGCAEGKKNKLVFICDNYEEACIVAANAENRSDQKNINICRKFPHYNSKNFFVQIKTIIDYPSWYIEGYFKK